MLHFAQPRQSFSRLTHLLDFDNMTARRVSLASSFLTADALLAIDRRDPILQPDFIDTMQLNINSVTCTTVAAILLLTVGDVSFQLQNLAQAGDIAPSKVGPDTEKRFPPLVVPDGFQATLFACDPLIEYPSVIAIGPRTKTLFVAHDYLTGLGIEIVRRDEVRILEDTNDDGYADKSTVFAKGLNSIQGLAYHDGMVFVMHAPLLTSLRDTNGDDVADERHDLIKGLGLTPEENSNRLHCANGVVAGYDGWLYLALGDRGCDVTRPEGDRLLFRQGGILRCRTDGTNLHVFSTGLRNIYDIALDAELNVFVRDNENDGGDYMTRVCHCFFGSDHGYPYHYYEHPAEIMPPLADLGRGSSAGVTTYLETAFPKEYQNSLFACEWGRAIVGYQRKQLGSSFAPLKETTFAFGAPEDPYGFKPTDVVVDRDGSLFISDWCDGQRPQRGRGRIYRITYVGDTVSNAAAKGGKSKTRKLTAPTIESWIAQLNSPGHHQRIEAQVAIEHAGKSGRDKLIRAIQHGHVSPTGRLHAIWIIAAAQSQEAIKTLFELAQSEHSVPVQIQTIRAITDLTDPILVQGNLKATRGNTTICQRLGELPVERDPRLLREVIIALGRLNWIDAPHWLSLHINSQPDTAITHATAWTFRQANNWPYVFTFWDDPLSPLRTAALNAAAEQTIPVVVDALLERCMNRNQYAKMLVRVYKKPAPYQYWGFRPDPRPANTVAWDRTELIANKLLKVFLKRDKDSATVRAQILREGVSIPLATLAECLVEEFNPARLTVILDALKERTNPSIPSLFMKVIQSTKVAEKNRLTALNYLISGPDEVNEPGLLDLAQSLEDGQVLAEVIFHLGQRPKLKCDTYLVRQLQSGNGAVRSAAVHTLAMRKHVDISQQTIELLDDEDVRVRRAAVFAAGKLGIKEASDRLLHLAADEDRKTCRESLNALRELAQPGAVRQALAALGHADTQLAAIDYLADHGGPDQLDTLTSIAQTTRSIDILTKVVRAISSWDNDHSSIPEKSRLYRAISKIQSDSNVVLRWTIFGSLSTDTAKTLLNQLIAGFDPTGGQNAIDTIPNDLAHRHSQVTTGTDARVVIDSKYNVTQQPVWLAVAHLENPTKSDVEFFAGSNATLQVWLNTKLVHKRDTVTNYRPNADHFTAQLPGNTSQLVLWMDGAKDKTQFHLRFRRKSSKTEHERLSTFALMRQGDIIRGSQVFAATEKSQCIKCHQVGDTKGRIGPDLTGIGDRFSRIHLIESILEPSRTVAPSYETLNIVLSNGRLMSGVKIKDDIKNLTIGDNQGKVHSINKADIEEIRIQPRSTMPDGLEERLTDQEFIDLLEYLLSQKKK